jgi:hypothetical protein
MQLTCKAFIAPDSAARFPKERYTHVPRNPRRVRHAREATDKIGMGLLALLPKCDNPYRR